MEKNVDLFWFISSFHSYSLCIFRMPNILLDTQNNEQNRQKSLSWNLYSTGGKDTWNSGVIRGSLAKIEEREEGLESEW